MANNRGLGMGKVQVFTTNMRLQCTRVLLWQHNNGVLMFGYSATLVMCTERTESGDGEAGPL